jgi:ribosomal protein S18 acetylase RimI-like enzyme
MITIRTAQRNDAPIIAQYNAAMALETEHLHLDMDRLLKGVNGLFDDASRGFYVVAEHEGTVIGQLMITYEWSDWRNGVFWWIQSVFVKEEFRAQKVFRSLYEHIAAMAYEQGNVCGIRLYVEKDNTKAHAVYEKLGMNVTQYDLLETDFILKR